jgi:hypothetical protein
MTCNSPQTPRRAAARTRAALFGFSTLLAVGTIAAPAFAEPHGGGHHGGGRGGGHRVYRGGRGYAGGWYAPPPVVYGAPYYPPPPVVYGPGISINIP